MSGRAKRMKKRLKQARADTRQKTQAVARYANNIAIIKHGAGIRSRALVI